ncbi:MAG: hypothetical protein WC732_09690 [Candidatus Omnitrophota bacterium]
MRPEGMRQLFHRSGHVPAEESADYDLVTLYFLDAEQHRISAVQRIVCARIELPLRIAQRTADRYLHPTSGKCFRVLQHVPSADPRGLRTITRQNAGQLRVIRTRVVRCRANAREEPGAGQPTVYMETFRVMIAGGHPARYSEIAGRSGCIDRDHARGRENAGQPIISAFVNLIDELECEHAPCDGKQLHVHQEEDREQRFKRMHIFVVFANSSSR